MKAQEKVMITQITYAIEQTTRLAVEHPKEIINAIEKSARKLAHKLVRTIKKEQKTLTKAKRNKPVGQGSHK